MPGNLSIRTHPEIEYVRSDQENKLFSEVTLRSSKYSFWIEHYERRVQSSPIRNLFIEDQITTIKSFYSEPRDKINQAGNYEISKTGFETIIKNSDRVKLNDLFDFVNNSPDYETSFIRPLKIYYPLQEELNRDAYIEPLLSFGQLNEVQKYDAIVDLLILGGCQAILLERLKYWLNNLLALRIVEHLNLVPANKQKPPTGIKQTQAPITLVNNFDCTDPL